MRQSTVAALCAALVATSGCGSWVCRNEAIRATLRAPLLSGEDALSDVLAGNFEAKHDESPEMEALEGAIEGQAIAGRGVSMWLQRGLDHTLNLTLRLPTPLRSGDVLPVTGVHSSDRASWGTFANPTPGLSVGLRLDGFVATAASGTARVVAVDPLRIDLDLVVAGGGIQHAIKGTLNVRHETSTDSCFQ
jgi:hypothetical protein